jgi:hypothetical protein
MIAAWNEVARQKQISRKRRGRNANQTSTSSNRKMRPTVNAWKPLREALLDVPADPGREWSVLVVVVHRRERLPLQVAGEELHTPDSK